MKLIVGLGNPGKKFATTRHNTGHLFIDFVAKKKRVEPSSAKLVKTSVFMNESGKEVKSLTTNYQLPITDLLVVHDDMDFPLGEFKLQFGRSAAGHKGVQSVIEELGTRDFWRLRIGIGRPSSGVFGEDYVLALFSKDDLGRLEDVFEAACAAVSEWLG